MFKQTTGAEIYDAEVLLRGVQRARPARRSCSCSVRLRSQALVFLTPISIWRSSSSHGYAGLGQIEVNFDEAKELGLGHYQGRSGTGVRRWPVMVCIARALLKLAATGFIQLDLPKLHWSWYRREESVGGASPPPDRVLSPSHFSRSGCSTYRAEIEDRSVMLMIDRLGKPETTVLQQSPKYRQKFERSRRNLVTGGTDERVFTIVYRPRTE